MFSSDVACAVLTRFTGVEMRGSPPLAPPLCVCGDVYLTLPYLHVHSRLGLDFPPDVTRQSVTESENEVAIHLGSTWSAVINRTSRAVQSPPADGDFTMAAPEGEESEDEGEGEEDEEDRQTKLERYGTPVRLVPRRFPPRVVHLIRPFERDDREYRERRATDLYNSAAKVGRNLEQLLGDYDSAVPSILTDIVTRQMVQDGCAYRPSPALARPLSSPPGPLTAAVVGCRRGCDGHEAFGAKYHFTMHNRVCIRKLTSGTTEHKRVRRVDATRRTESPARRCYPPC